METIREVRKEFGEIIRELEVGEAEVSQGTATSARATELTKMAQRAEELQGKIDQFESIAGTVRKGRELQSQSMPVREDPRPKRVKTTAGHLFVGSEAFRQYRAMGKQGWSGKVDVKDVRNSPVVELLGDEAEKWITKAYDPATLSDLGSNAIIPEQRDPELVRYEEPEMLTIRDVMSVIPATSDTIRFVRHTATGRAAGSQWDPDSVPPQARGGLKPYLTITAASETVSTETIAVLSKVTEQDVDDSPRLIAMINGEMRLDVRVEEERQLVYGDGTAGNLEGLYEQGVEAQEFARSAVGDTLIDTIRRMRTDLRKARVMPNAILVDPLDWEEVELVKSSSDEHYIWGTITDARGPRIWSLRVVESDAMTNLVTDERRILMGDFIRGATLYDRHDVRLAIGFVDDDFARNLRTLRAEERLALAVKRAYAFSWTQTQAPGS